MYIDYQYMLDRLGEANILRLTQSEEQSTIDQNKVLICCQDAETLVNTYCSKKYTVPFTTVPDEIKRITFSIARYYLFIYNRVEAFQIESERQDPVYIEYEKAIKMLELIVNGDINLNLINETLLEKAIKVNNNKRIFSDKSYGAMC